MLNAPWNDTQTHIYAGKYGSALRNHFEQEGIVDDIHKSVSASAHSVKYTDLVHDIIDDKTPKWSVQRISAGL